MIGFTISFLSFCSLSGIFETSASTALFAYDTKWYPNPSWLGGLNTEITLGRFFDFEVVFLQNLTFYASVDGTTYGLNVTSPANLNILLLNFFDEFGTYFYVDRACSLTLFVQAKGNASKVNGASALYHASNQTLDLTISEASYVGVHWGSGGSVTLNDVDRFGYIHSQDIYPYQTTYGFGIWKGGYWQYAFNTRTFVQNGRDDIETISLQLGENVGFTYNEGSINIIEYDPYEYVQVADEWYPETDSASWVRYDDDLQYLDVGFNVRFIQTSANESIPSYWSLKYNPKFENQDTNVTVISSIEGTIVNEQSAIFYIGLSDLPFLDPVEVRWDLSYLFIGFGAMFMMIFAPTFALYKIKKGEIPEGIGWGIVLFIIAIGLLVVWLWR